MMTPARRPLILLSIVLLSGCRSESERVADIATQAMREQASQNEEMARLNREIADAARHLVEADSQSRRELLAAYEQFVTQRDALEQERRQIAATRIRDSLLAPVLWHLGTMALCMLPIALVILVIRQRLPSEPELINEVLIEDMLSEAPRLISASRPAHRLPGPGCSNDRQDESDNSL